MITCDGAERWRVTTGGSAASEEPVAPSSPSPETSWNQLLRAENQVSLPGLRESSLGGSCSVKGTSVATEQTNVKGEWS